MSKKYFIIGDVHGESDLLEEMLSHWDSKNQQLIFLGDLIDRGPDNKKSVLTAKKLVEEENAWYIMGNHEVMFLAWIDNPVDRFDHYMRNNGNTTINHLLGRPVDTPIDSLLDCERIKNEYVELIEFLRRRPLFIDEGNVLFVHAGVDLRLSDWRDTIPKDFYWIREPFHTGKNNTGKTIVFGHTPLQGLNEDGNVMRLWQSDGKIGMDGGAVFGGVLHGVVWQDGEIKQVYSIQNPHASAVDE